MVTFHKYQDQWVVKGPRHVIVPGHSVVVSRANRSASRVTIRAVSKPEGYGDYVLGSFDNNPIFDKKLKIKTLFERLVDGDEEEPFEDEGEETLGCY